MDGNSKFSMNQKLNITLIVVGIILVLGTGVWILVSIPFSFETKDKLITLSSGNIKKDIILSNNEVTRITGDQKVFASIILRDNAKLIIENGDFEFQIKTDLDKGVYLYDSSELIVTNAKIHSTGHMYEIELRGDAKMVTRDADIIDHSAIKLFDNTELNANNGLIDELRMDNQGQAYLENVEVYMNMQYFFQVDEPITFPEAYENISHYILEPAGDKAWKVEFNVSETQGWQVDVYPGTEFTIKDSTDVNLGLRSDGKANTTLNINNPSGQRINYVINTLGFDLSIENSEIHFINLYLKDKDEVEIIGTKDQKAGYNLNLLEIVLLDDAKLKINTAHLVAQLAHTNDNAELSIENSLVGSTDPDDPIISELAAKDEAFIEVKNSDLTYTDVLVENEGVIYIENSTYDKERLLEKGNGKIEIKTPQFPKLINYRTSSVDQAY